MSELTFQLLVAALENNIDELPDKMSIDSDGIIVNQCDFDRTDIISYKDHCLKVINSSKRGVGNSRNMALSNATADLVLFSDEDITYYPGYEEMVIKAFENNPKADVITFNVEVDERRRTYFNEDIHRITWKNYGRYPAYAIAAKLSSLKDNNISYSELFGGGAKYSNGEDSLFLHDCLKKKLLMMTDVSVIGRENYRESTWFKGYTEKFFFDRGVLYHFLYGIMAYIFGARFLIKNRKEMLKDISFLRAYILLTKGIKEGKTL